MVESVCKLIASGASFQDTYLTFQEYFERLGKDPKRWGKPLAALLGAFRAQMELGIGAIGGKDSMSGSFDDMDVPPTLVSFAIAPQDDDMYIADVYWLVLSQLRAEKADEAQKTLKQHYRPDMYVGHHTAYEKAMRVAAGFAPMEDMLAELDAEEDDLQFAMTAYGLCVLLEAHGETEKADALRQKLLKRDGFWFCFSYLAAYSDYKYTVKPATVK